MTALLLSGAGGLALGLFLGVLFARCVLKRLGVLDAAVRRMRLELNNHRLAVSPQRMTWPGPPPLPPPPRDKVTLCAPEYHAPRSIYPVQPWELCQ